MILTKTPNFENDASIDVLNGFHLSLDGWRKRYLQKLFLSVLWSINLSLK